MINKIIHQIWFQGEKNIPKSYPDYTKSWKNENTKYGYKYMFWDESKIINLLVSFYPQLFNKFNSLPKMIQKVDMAKLIILYHYGGIYIDIDLECFKPLENLLKEYCADKNVMLIEFNVNFFEKFIAFKKIYGTVVQNNFMGCKKQHPFIKHCINMLLNEDLEKGYFESSIYYVFRTTGPGLVTKSYTSYVNKDDIVIVPYQKMDPLSWCNYELNECSKKSCKNQFPKAYAIHHYGSKHSTHNWNDNIEKNIGLICCKYKKWLQTFIVIIFVLTVIILSKNKLI